MGRTFINLSFRDRDFIIEYNRSSVKYVLTHQKEELIDQLIVMIKGGLLMHHEKEMPTDDEVFGWVMALGDDMKVFAETLEEMVQGVLSTFEEDRKNLKWGKVNEA